MNDMALVNARQWEAGESGCGRLIVGLKRQLGRMRPGEVLKVKALGEGASIDIPAWCRMTGNTLVSDEHPHYVVRKKGD